MCVFCLCWFHYWLTLFGPPLPIHLGHPNPQLVPTQLSTHYMMGALVQSGSQNSRPVADLIAFCVHISSCSSDPSVDQLAVQSLLTAFHFCASSSKTWDCCSSQSVVLCLLIYIIPSVCVVFLNSSVNLLHDICINGENFTFSLNSYHGERRL